jgi:branched-chain amino acid transport system ATP-binding protein
MSARLEVESVSVRYGEAIAVHDVSLTVRPGEVVALVGPNGAGKTSLVSTLAGLMKPSAGRIALDGTDITELPAHKVAELGMTLVPQGRQLFADMSVLDNLRLGAYTKRARKERERTLESVFDRFPVLLERQRSKAGELSGGQQQMLTIGRALMTRPAFVMFDEPSLGLAPLIVREVGEIIRQISADSVTVLLVEQNIPLALDVASRGYVIETGIITAAASSEQLGARPELQAAYLGIVDE